MALDTQLLRTTDGSPANSVCHSFRMSNARGAWPPYNIGLRTIAQVTATDTVKPDEPQHLLRLKVASLPDPDGLPEMRGFEAKLLASRFGRH